MQPGGKLDLISASLGLAFIGVIAPFVEGLRPRDPKRLIIWTTRGWVPISF